MNDTISITKLPDETWKGKDVLLISAGVVIFFLGFSVVVGVLRATSFPGLQISEPTISLSIASALLEVIAIIGSVYFLGLRRRKFHWSAAGMNPLSHRWLVLALLIGLIVIPLSGLIAVLIELILGMPIENPQLDFLAPEGFSWLGFLGMLLLGGILAPIAEEIYFRGVLYQWLRVKLGVWPGILLSALIFGVMHGNLVVGGAAAILGVILAWAYECSHSLWSAILIHIINNGVKILLLYLLIAVGIIPPGG